MKRRVWMALAATASLSQAAFAQGQFLDPSTGFGIRTAPPYTVEPTSRRQFDVGVGVRSNTGEPPAVGAGPYICEAGFKAASQNNGLTRTEINELIGKPEWRKAARSIIELGFNVTGESTFTLAGFRGVEYEVTPKAGPGAENIRALMSIIETAKGRVTVACLTDRGAFGRAKPQFRNIRSMVTLPM
jgi:hypothetical protein